MHPGEGWSGGGRSFAAIDPGQQALQGTIFRVLGGGGLSQGPAEPLRPLHSRDLHNPTAGLSMDQAGQQLDRPGH
jgi:hypothetical protein